MPKGFFERYDDLLLAMLPDKPIEWVLPWHAKRPVRQATHGSTEPSAKFAKLDDDGGSSDPPPTNEFMVPEPPLPPDAFIRAKEEARAKAKQQAGPRGHSRMQGWGQREHNALVHGCSLAEIYDSSRDDVRLTDELWVATEKFDGCRAVWDPQHADGPGFRNRSGSHFKPPPSFAALLPPDMVLDGEMWAGRRNFASVGILMGSKSLDGGHWHSIAWNSLIFVVFDAPKAGGDYLQRMDRARARLASTASDRVVVVPTVPVADAAAKDELLERVISAGGEGLVLRRVAAPWRAGKSKPPSILKVKDWLDAEARLLEYKPAPAARNLPTVRCVALNAPNVNPSTSFELTVGRGEEERWAKAVREGAIVTFTYRQISKVSGQPTIAGGGPRLHRVHDRTTCDCYFCSP